MQALKRYPFIKLYKYFNIIYVLFLLFSCVPDTKIKLKNPLENKSTLISSSLISEQENNSTNSTFKINLFWTKVEGIDEYNISIKLYSKNDIIDDCINANTLRDKRENAGSNYKYIFDGNCLSKKHIQVTSINDIDFIEITAATDNNNWGSTAGRKISRKNINANSKNIYFTFQLKSVDLTKTKPAGFYSRTASGAFWGYPRSYSEGQTLYHVVSLSDTRSYPLKGDTRISINDCPNNREDKINPKSLKTIYMIKQNNTTSIRNSTTPIYNKKAAQIFDSSLIIDEGCVFRMNNPEILKHKDSMKISYHIISENNMCTTKNGENGKKWQLVYKDVYNYNTSNPTLSARRIVKELCIKNSITDWDGFWEPFLYYGKDNKLRMLYANDTDPDWTNKCAQKIHMITIHDELDQSKNTDIALGNCTGYGTGRGRRDGMPVMAKLDDNNYYMVFESLYVENGIDRGDIILLKSTDGGISWKDRQIIVKGSFIAAKNRGGCPYIKIKDNIGYVIYALDAGPDHYEYRIRAISLVGRGIYKEVSINARKKYPDKNDPEELDIGSFFWGSMNIVNNQLRAFAAAPWGGSFLEVEIPLNIFFQAKPAPPKAPLGWFKLDDGTEMFYWSNNENGYCSYIDQKHYTSCTGKTERRGPINNYSTLPSNMNNSYTCCTPNIIREGLFKVGDGIYWSDGQNAYCNYTDMNHFIFQTGRTNTSGIAQYNRLPSNMANHLTCGEDNSESKNCDAQIVENVTVPNGTHRNITSITCKTFDPTTYANYTGNVNYMCNNGGYTEESKDCTTTNVVKGNITVQKINGKDYINGWVCETGINQSIKGHIYVGGDASSGTYLTQFLANKTSESAVSSECVTAGIQHRFSVEITNSMKNIYQGKKISVHGISVIDQSGYSNLLINGSGQHTIPISKPIINSFTANGSGSINVKIGDRVNYEWLVTGASNVNSYVTLNKEDSCPGLTFGIQNPWEINSNSGTISGIIANCQQDVAYSITIIAENIRGDSVSKTINVAVSKEVVPQPEISFFTANGANSIYVEVGDKVNYRWSTNNATEVSSYVTLSKEDTCPSLSFGKRNLWGAKTLSGTSSGTVISCQAGVTYYITILAENKDGYKFETIQVHVK